MPHTRQPPGTISRILATATPDPTWSELLEEVPVPTGADWGGDIAVLKQLSMGMLPTRRKALDASRPPEIYEEDLYVDISGTDLKPEAGQIRILLCHRRRTDSQVSNEPSPVIVLFHGGGHTIGSPETELAFARLLVKEFNAVVLMPAYRLAPEHVSPSSFSDALEVVKMVAQDIRVVHTATGSNTTTSSDRTKLQILRPEAYSTLSDDFIIGGVSAGATIASSINHLYRTWRVSQEQPGPAIPGLPTISGLFLSSGSYINPRGIPTAYKPFYLSHDQNADTLPLDRDLYKLFANAAKHDQASPIWSSFDQRGRSTGPVRERVGEDHAWMAGTSGPLSNTNGPNADASSPSSAATAVVADPSKRGVRVYFQASGADISRDDTLIYERVLREECRVETRLDLYEGFGHCFWNMGGPYPEMEMSLKRERDSVEGVGWLLRR